MAKRRSRSLSGGGSRRSKKSRQRQAGSAYFDAKTLWYIGADETPGWMYRQKRAWSKDLFQERMKGLRDSVRRLQNQPCIGDRWAGNKYIDSEMRELERFLSGFRNEEVEKAVGALQQIKQRRNEACRIAAAKEAAEYW